MADGSDRSGVWSPLNHKLFRLVLVVNLFAILATFMNGLAAAWALTDLTESPALLAALQFATAIPAVLLALVAGALSDIVSRKSLILVGLGGSTVTAGVFAAITAAGVQSAFSILALTVALGAFTALAAPAWLAVIPGLVSRQDLPGAMALSAASLNVAMAAGPALAGLLIAAASPTAVFGLNALVFAISIVALRTWKPESRGGLPHEHLISAIRVGVQYFRFDRPLQVTIGKTVPLVLIGTAVPALLPALSRFQLGVGPAGFGLLAAAGGLGAVVGLVLLPLIRRRMDPDAIVTGAALAQAASIAGLAATESTAIAFALLTLVGIGLLAITSTVTTTLQIVLPAWVRGRGVAVFLLALQGSLAIGAIMAGFLAERAGVTAALYTAAVALAVSAIAVSPLRIGRYQDHDASAVQFVEPAIPSTSGHDADGPILLSLTWDIPPNQRETFFEIMQSVKKSLRRQGALDFHLMEDVAVPGRIVESFRVATWAEYQLLPLRTTASDKQVHDNLIELIGDVPPVVVAKQFEV